MAYILNIETATTVCSVSLAKDGISIASKELNNGYTHAENITLFIEEVINKANISYTQLDAVAISKGPGSYTGLRIGVSTAKGICFALNKPLIAINTLLAMANQVKDKYVDSLLCPMIDARRMEIYCAVYDLSLAEQLPTSALIIAKQSFDNFLEKSPIVFFGDGADKCKETITHPHAIFENHIFPSSISMAALSQDSFNAKQFENVAYFEPYYLKDFIGTKPSKPQ